MENQKIIIGILELLETMEEGLFYIKEKLAELNIEATTTVFEGFIDAFSSVETTIIPILDILEDNEIVEKTDELRKRIEVMVEEYGKKNGQKFYETIQLYLGPAFKSWKEEIELLLRPYVVS